jgi:hypothetical protein
VHVVLQQFVFLSYLMLMMSAVDAWTDQMQADAHFNHTSIKVLSDVV